NNLFFMVKATKKKITKKSSPAKKKAPEQVFGYELLLDCYDCKPKVCGDLDHCYSYLDKMVDFIDMKKQEPPTIFRTDRKSFPDKAGLSGWVPLVESSIVIHTLSRKNFISIDVYSCKKFSPEKVVEFTKRYFAPKKIEKQFILRGKHYYSKK
ncbi:MAG: S-adenosylmethionine decarboxylase, partial [Nanoarchaeota archaeon]|nr:S-adenosylmethionine decarboxylase [Nanoarchaeota archaeon]